MSASTPVRLKELVAPVKKWQPNRDAPDDSFTYIDLGCVDQDRKEVVEPRQLRCAEAPSRARQVVEAGDVLVSTVRPNLNAVARVPPSLNSATASTGFCVLRPRPRVLDGTYLFHYVRSPVFVNAMVKRATGASYPAVTDRIVCETEVLLRPLAEQRRIAQLLDRADALRARRRTAIEELDQLARSIFLEMFGNRGERGERWSELKLGDLMSTGPQNGLYKPAEHYGSGTPILRIDGFYDGRVVDISRLKRVRLTDAEIKRYALRPGEIVINRVNSREYLGKSAVIPVLTEPTVFESNMMRFGVDHHRLEPVYLIRYMQTPSFRAHVLRSAKDAVNQSSINQSDVKGLSVPVPPLELQKRFADRIAALDRLKATYRAHLAELDTLFASLQHRAFRGEL